MKTPITTVYLGQPLDHPSERSFLERLRADLAARGIPAIILANFITGRTFRQVDFLIVTATRTVHCELKAYTVPVIGRVNGPWLQVLPDGTTRPLEEGNPYRQAQDITYALSDAMRQLVARDATVPMTPRGQFFRDVDTVVCLFPAIPAGSRFDRFAYVAVLGYEQLLQRLAAPGPNPPWTAQHWEAFIRSQGLYKQETRSDEERARIAARHTIDDYRRRFAVAHTTDLHELVAVAATVDGELEAQPDLHRLVLNRRTVVISGSSGLGKTHVARHAAVGFAQAGHVPVWVRCREYGAGGFAVLNGRAIAPYTTEASDDFFSIARDAGSVVIMILDGFNECPAAHRQEMLEETAAAVLTHGVHVLITTQTLPALPEPLNGIEVVMQLPNPIEREALVRSYGAAGSLLKLTSFATPFELSLAADCIVSLPGVPTRAELMEAYIGRQTETEAIREALRAIARAMDDDIRISLPIVTVRRILQREGVAADVIDATFACQLLVIGQGSIAFRHELFGRFLAAMALVIHTRSGAELGQLLKMPQHADLRDDAISLEHDPERLRDALREMCDVGTLYAALCGDLGPIALSVASSEATGLLAEAGDRTCLEMVTPAPTFGGLFGERWILNRPWSRYEMALLTAAGTALTRGVLITEITRVLDRTDVLIELLVDQLRAAGVKAPITQTIAAIYGVGQTNSGTALAASYLVLACDWHRPNFGHRSPTDRNALAATELFSGSTARAWSRFQTALLVVDPREQTNAAMLPELITAAWNAGGYHLRLQALDTARFAASYLSDPDAARVVEVLEGLTTTNLGLSTTLIEALAAYGALQPINDLEHIRAEIAAVLRRPEDPDAWEEAHSIVMKQLEEADIFGDYGEGLAELSPPDRGTIALMAARGAPRDGWFTHFVVQQLIHHASLDDRPVQEVLASFASVLPTEVPHQAPLAVHLDALVACAGFLDRPPSIGAPEDRRPELEAWRAIRELVFELARHEQLSSVTTMLWDRAHRELAHASVDVLFHLQHAAMLRDPSRETAHSLLLAGFPVEVRTLLEWGLLHRDELTSLFRYDDRAGRDRYMVRTLGAVGDQGTARMLRALLSDADLGESAFEAIRRLEVPARAAG